MFISNQLPESLQNVYWTGGKDKPNTIFSKEKIYETQKIFVQQEKLAGHLDRITLQCFENVMRTFYGPQYHF